MKSFLIQFVILVITHATVFYLGAKAGSQRVLAAIKGEWSAIEKEAGKVEAEFFAKASIIWSRVEIRLGLKKP